MQLGTLPSRIDDTDEVATTLRRAAERSGNRPAVTLVLPDGRQEQSYAGLAQWAAKGAHLLETELLLHPGDRVLLDSPPSWTTAAVALACWWAGIAVTMQGPADAAVVHVLRAGDVDADLPTFTLGDGFDGGPAADRSGASEPWVDAVQAFPDQPPPPRAAPDALALVAGDARLDQAGVLTEARGLGDGPYGLDAGAGQLTATDLVAIAARPLVSGAPTVVVRGVERTAAAADQVRRWG